MEIHDPGDVDGIARPGNAISFADRDSRERQFGRYVADTGYRTQKAQGFALLRTGAATIVDDDGNSEMLVVTAVDNTKLTLAGLA